MITSNKFPASKPLIYGLLYAPNDENQSLMNSKNSLFPASIPEIHSNAKSPIPAAQPKDALTVAAPMPNAIAANVIPPRELCNRDANNDP